MAPLAAILSLLFLQTSLAPLPCFSGPIFSEFIRPNFTASNFGFIGNNGAFLASRNNVFRASVYNPVVSNEYHLCVLHVESNEVVWSANRDSIINMDRVVFSTSGIFIYSGTNSLVWRAESSSLVSLIQLQDTGNLVLLDKLNRSLWESFDHPTDTILMNQMLKIGSDLTGAKFKKGLVGGDYKLVVTKEDAMLRWKGQTYWSMSVDRRTIKDQNAPVDYLVVNGSGLYLISGNSGKMVVVWQVILSPSKLRRVVLDSSGKLRVQSGSGSSWITEFSAPEDDCLVPQWCGSLGLCREAGGANNNSYCSCPDGLAAANQTDLSKGCTLPTLADFCLNSSSSPATKYLLVGAGIGYLASSFVAPIRQHASVSICQELCSANCSCRGVLYNENSGSCFLIQGDLGSLRDGVSKFMKAYMRIADRIGVGGGEPNVSRLPLMAFIVLPPGGTLLLISLFALYVSWLRKLKKPITTTAQINPREELEDEIDLNSIPGLPTRFSLSLLEAATDNFKNKIGSGGFGMVFKGVLPDGTQVAVKKINNLGNQGKKEFCTEIAVIGSIHHVNLVRLIGFCVEGNQRLLVYEYMNLGSLDRSLFSQNDVILDWKERVEIAIGTARGLAYLHSSCQPKIIHCDIKPENILLNDAKQIKLSDFGLSKLLTLEGSNLFTTMRGTRGYLAPEWLTNAGISEKTDVYSYGMVLLEIIRGRKNCSTNGNGVGIDVYFPMYALEMHEQVLYLELVDPRLGSEVDSAEIEKLVKVALCCVQEEPRLRPSMGSVVGMLEGVIAVSEPRVQSLNFLRFYGQRFTEASRLGSESCRIDVVPGTFGADDSCVATPSSPPVLSAQVSSLT